MHELINVKFEFLNDSFVYLMHKEKSLSSVNREQVAII